MANDKLTPEQIQDWLSRNPGWAASGGDAIGREFRFADFVHAVAFVNRVAELAEAAEHHPDIDIRYSKVTLRLSTHDAGGVTGKDLDLARAAESAAAAARAVA